MPTVSVVMSVLNGERFLAEAVGSILTQSLTDFEFIIVNDGSTDRTSALLHGYQKSDSRLRVFHQQNKGLVESLNRGCALAQGKYIARMDADDVALKDRLLWQVSFLENHPEVAVVGGAIETIDAAGRSFAVERFPTTDFEIKSSLLRGNCSFAHPTVVMRRETLQSANGYRKVVNHAEDYDLWLRIAERFRLANLGSIVLRYRRHPNQISIRRCRQQAVSALAARTAALLRRSGSPDPLDTFTEITPETLRTLGVTEAEQQRAVVRAYVTTVRGMCDAGEFLEAVQAIQIGRTLDWDRANGAEITDFRLLTARVYWHQRLFGQSLFTACNALARRPVTMGRPLKRLLSRLSFVCFGEIRPLIPEGIQQAKHS